MKKKAQTNKACNTRTVKRKYKYVVCGSYPIISHLVYIEFLFNVTSQFLSAGHNAFSFLYYLLVNRGSLGTHNHMTLK